MTEFKDALDAMSAYNKVISDPKADWLGTDTLLHHVETIRRALRIADRLMQEPSDELIAGVAIAGHIGMYEAYDILKYLQAYVTREIDNAESTSGATDTSVLDGDGV